MWCLPPGNCPACPYGLTFRNCLWMWANICMKTIVSFHTKDENNISSELLSIPFSIFCTRACLKKAFCKMCVTICGIFCPDEGAVAGYGNWIRVKYPAKWGVQIAGMIFQTRSNLYLFFYMVILLPHGYYIRILYQKPFRNWFTWYRYWLFQTYYFPKKNSPSDLLYVNETVLFIIRGQSDIRNRGRELTWFG